MTKDARLHNEEMTVSLISYAQKNWTATFKRMRLGYFLIPHTNINLKQTKYLNVKMWIHKTPGGKHSLVLMSLSPKEKEIKCENKQMGPQKAFFLH